VHLLTDGSEIDADLEKAQTERNILEELLRRLIEQNAREPMDQEEYNARYSSLDERYRQQTERYDQLETEKQRRLRLRDDLKQFIDTLKYSDIVTDFSPDAWYALAECITVNAKDDIRVTFRNGTTI
jgi:ABC-type phosphate transport system auxiliary subunit